MDWIEENEVEQLLHLDLEQAGKIKRISRISLQKIICLMAERE